MTPTPKLRFVERSRPDYPGANTGRVVRVLQQLWEADITDIITGKADGEWRDVPLEKEHE
jgi:hypothetical protein